METNPKVCCSACWHTPEKPCPELIECLLNGSKCHDAHAHSESVESRLARLRRDEVDHMVVYVGAGTCGLGAGARKTIRALRSWLARHGVEAEIVEVGCIGLCSAEPLVDIQLPGRTRVAFASITEEKVAPLMDAIAAGRIPHEMVLGQHRNPKQSPWETVPYLDEHPFFAPQKRWVLTNCGLIDPNRIDEYIARGGYRALSNTLKANTPAEVCNIVEQAGLRGRGGGGFPTGKKWKIALNTASDQKYLVCNADEGDPGAFMDRAVIEGDPHRLLEGMAIAAYAIGATKAYVYIRAEYPLAIERLKRAIQEAQQYGLLGYNILDSGFDLEINIKQGAGAFVCGEETALIHSIEGKRGMPRPRPPFPAVRGLFEKPTVINNVETLANLPALLGNGAEWFSAVGTETSKGTKVFALSGKVSRTGLVEVAMGTTLRQVVMEIGGGIPNGKRFKAVQIGGPSGGCIPEQHLDTRIDYESLKTVGAMMGSGGLVVMDEDTCMVDVAKFFMEFIQRESCGKCIPCREGTLRMLEILKRITRGRRSEKGNEALERFMGVLYMTRLAEVIKDTSLCGLGQTAPNPVLSTLRWFRDEYEAHVYERRCPAGVCTELRTFEIEPDLCEGCGLCVSKCPTAAIVGLPRRIHYIVADKCIGCGSCADVCPSHAVKLAEEEPAAATVAEKAESGAVRSIFAPDVFEGWHEGKSLLRMDDDQ
ncbi:MAG TPA: NADH-ubiquinone oxidoreductase-F iron-sulfur binding region domain-containing protein [Candidatus Hydrogenedentes bacterium]|nr:NADH-ubiquinone oxidoreductase-F iron-sulfur binding region domain-containing protein [Candidatus Hydrogenedentota bacterium]HPO85600.1 NADH-ubiquinone oxidoreductase-F iron-sulfur binding region domain-containing protein [Candidatus Hydrogenedentota bacterium]